MLVLCRTDVELWQFFRCHEFFAESPLHWTIDIPGVKGMIINKLVTLLYSLLQNFI